VPVTDFAVYAKGNVSVQDGVVGDVGSQTGSVQVKGKKIVVQGDVSAGGAVQVSSGAAVKGAVNSGAAITKASKGVVTGTSRASLTGADLSSVLAGGLLPVHTFSAGGVSYTGTLKTLTLNPGSYGSVGGKKAGTLYLQSGSYYLSGLSGNGAKIMLDLSHGAINLYVTGNLNLSKSSIFVKDGSGGYVAYSHADRDLAGLVYAEVDGKATLSNSQWFGTLYTPDAKLLASNSSVTGALYGGTSIQLKGKGQTIRYSPLAGPSDPGSGGQPSDPPADQSGDGGTGTGDPGNAGTGTGDTGSAGTGSDGLGDVANWDGDVNDVDPGNGDISDLAPGNGILGDAGTGTGGLDGPLTLTSGNGDGGDVPGPTLDADTATLPEPTTIALLCSGLVALVARRRFGAPSA